MEDNRKTAIPFVIDSISKNENHWSDDIRKLSKKVLDDIKESDIVKKFNETNNNN